MGMRKEDLRHILETTPHIATKWSKCERPESHYEVVDSIELATIEDAAMLMIEAGWSVDGRCQRGGFVLSS